MAREWEPDVRSKDPPTAEALRTLGARIPGFDAEAVETYITLAIVAAELQAKVDAIFVENGLSRARFITLVHLRKAETPLTPAELAVRTSTTTASMASLLEGLVAAGLIRREPRQDDRRSHWIHLTDAGLAKLDGTLPGVYGVMQRVMSSMSSEEQKSLVRTLLGLREAQQNL